MVKLDTTKKVRKIAFFFRCFLLDSSECALNFLHGVYDRPASDRALEEL